MLINFELLISKIKSLSPAAVRELAQRSGVPEQTIRKIRGGHTVNPRRDTLERLINALL